MCLLAEAGQAASHGDRTQILQAFTDLAAARESVAGTDRPFAALRRFRPVTVLLSPSRDTCRTQVVPAVTHELSIDAICQRLVEHSWVAAPAAVQGLRRA
jgi:hypothetical protein